MKKYSKWLILVVMAVILLSITPICMAANETYGSIVVSKVVSVYDGDTFKVNIDGWPDIIGKNISIRIYGIDTPEIRGTKGEAKQLALKAKALSAKRLLEAGTVTLRNIKRGKYFRIIAEVYVDRVHLGTLLIRNGLAKEYYGGKRPIW